MLILSHGTLGVDSGCKSPDFARVDLYLWQVSQVRTKSLTDFLIPGQLLLLLLLCLFILSRKPNRQSVYSKGAYWRREKKEKENDYYDKQKYKRKRGADEESWICKLVNNS